MRLVSILCLAGALASVPAVVAGQDHHGSKAATIMGFDQDRTTHHFFLFNDGATDWSACDIIKPNGDHFAQGGLRARSSDSIRGGLFKPPTGPEVIILSCAQGAVSQPVP